MTRVAQAADSLEAYDSIWLYDHFHTVPIPSSRPCSSAGCHRRASRATRNGCNIGQMVTCIGYRNPALLAKMASTVDVMSHGRLYCGIGAGWYEHEWRAYGYGFPETRERMRAFREATEIMVEDVDRGRAGLRRRISTPSTSLSISRKAGASRILRSGLAAAASSVTLKLVAKYGDACNIGGDSADHAAQIGGAARPLRHRSAASTTTSSARRISPRWSSSPVRIPSRRSSVRSSRWESRSTPFARSSSSARWTTSGGRCAPRWRRASTT